MKAEELGGMMVTLSFFASREFAESFLEGRREAVPLDEVAREMVDLLPAAMIAQAELGRGLEEVRRLRAPLPARSTKIGRNAPCPCGSGVQPVPLYSLCASAEILQIS